MVPAFRQNFVKVSPDVLLNSECGIAAGDLAGAHPAGQKGRLVRWPTDFL
jgi:hypothetical protein